MTGSERPWQRSLPRKRRLPPSPSLDHLRKQAKELLRRCREGDEAARARVREGHPRGVGDELALHDAQWVLAREYGFESWPRLVRHVEWIRELQEGIGWRTPEELVELLAIREWRSHVWVNRELHERIDEATDALLLGLGHANPRVRHDCARVLDHAGDARSIEPLRSLLRDPVPRVRAAALHALACGRCKRGEYPYDPIPDLVRMAESDEAPKVRRSALGGMWLQPPDARLVPVLERMLRSDAERALHRDVERVLQIHLSALSAMDLVERAQHEPCPAIRRLAIARLESAPPDPRTAPTITALLAHEPAPILRHRLHRARKRHEGDAPTFAGVAGHPLGERGGPKGRSK